MSDTGPFLSIGEFARVTRLSIRMLRRYHQAGLLRPALVDRRTNYRSYGLDQVATAQVIHRFRELGMPVREVAELVGVSDPEVRAKLIAAHLERLEDELERSRAAVATLRRLLQPQPAPLPISLRRAEEMTAAAVRAVVDQRELIDWYGTAMAELDAALAAAGARPTGPPGGLYDDELFTDERGGAIVYVPVEAAPSLGSVAPFVVPAAELATTVHAGPHDDIDVTYAALGAYVSRHAVAVAGPVREIYHVGPRDTDDSGAWRTELAWPIFTTAAGGPGHGA
jgi:DNA-binding transcriptional MerR regulator